MGLSNKLLCRVSAHSEVLDKRVEDSSPPAIAHEPQVDGGGWIAYGLIPHITMFVINCEAVLGS
jgi:hypothetical protein